MPGPTGCWSCGRARQALARAARPLRSPLGSCRLAPRPRVANRSRRRRAARPGPRPAVPRCGWSWVLRPAWPGFPSSTERYGCRCRGRPPRLFRAPVRPGDEASGRFRPACPFSAEQRRGLLRQAGRACRLGGRRRSAPAPCSRPRQLDRQRCCAIKRPPCRPSLRKPLARCGPSRRHSRTSPSAGLSRACSSREASGTVPWRG